MNFFSQLGSCCRPRPTPASTASPSMDHTHRPPPHSLADFRPLRHARSLWRPALPVIMEDRVAVADDHDKNFDKKPDKKSSATWFPDADDLKARTSSMPIIIFSPFSVF